MIEKPKRIIDKELLKKVSKQKCACYGPDCQGRIDPEHVTTRGAGGGDTIDNVMPLCRYHHTLKGQKGISYMIENFCDYRDWLNRHGRYDVIAKARIKSGR